MEDSDGSGNVVEDDDDDEGGVSVGSGQWSLVLHHAYMHVSCGLVYGMHTCQQQCCLAILI